MSEEQLTVPEYVRQRIQSLGFGVDGVTGEKREYEVMRDTLATVKELRSRGASRDEIETALGAWSELTGWAMTHPATDPE